MGILGTLGSIVSGVAPIVGTALGGPLGGIAGAALGGVASGMSNEDSIQSQKEYAKYQAELDQANWEKRFNMQNEYNDPSALRKRLENAGMNPNLAYGSLSPNMAANPSAGIPSGLLSKYQSAVESAVSLQQMANEQKRIENESKVAESQVDKNAADAEYARARAKREGVGYEVDLASKDFMIKYNEFLANSQANKDREFGIQEFRNEVERSRVELGFQELAFKKEKQKQDYEVGMAMARAAMIQAGAAVKQANAAVQTANALTRKLNAETDGVEIANNAQKQTYMRVPVYTKGKGLLPKVEYKEITVADYLARIGAYAQKVGVEKAMQDIDYRPFEFFLDAVSTGGNMYLQSKGVGPASQMTTTTTTNYDKRGRETGSTVTTNKSYRSR